MTVYQNIPALRFPGFGGEWHSFKLEEITSNFKSGMGITAKEIEDAGSYPVFGGNGLRGYAEKYTHDGDFVLIGRQGALCGNINRANGKTYISEHAIAVAGNELADTGWLYFKLDLMQLNQYSESSAQPGLAVNKLLKFKVLIPSLPEQQKIAAFLTEVDEKIQQLTRKKALLEQYKKGVIQQIFSREIRFREENGGEYPEWEERTLGELLTYPFTNSLSRSQLNYESGEVKNIHYGDIHTRFNTLFDITKEKVPFINGDIEIEKWIENVYCKTGDLIIADASEDYKDVGKAIEIVNVGNEKLVAGLHTYIARPNEGVAATGFLGYLFQVDYVRKQIMTMATGISVLGISKTNLNKLVLYMPTLPEQQKIASFLSALDEKIVQVGQQLEKTRGWKKGLLQGMFV